MQSPAGVATFGETLNTGVGDQFMSDEDRSEEIAAKDELIRNQATVIEVLEGRLAEKEARLCQIAHLTR